MGRAASPRLGTYAGIAGCTMFVGIVLGSPTLIALGAPFAAFLAIALAVAGQSSVGVQCALDQDRVMEGNELTATLTFVNDGPATELEIAIGLPPGIVRIDGPTREVLALPPAGTRTMRVTLRAERWGSYMMGEVAVRARDAFGVVFDDRRYAASQTLRVDPGAERLRTLIAPAATVAQSGAHLTGATADGIEFADVRPFTTGDQLRRINWRRSARSQTLYVNDSHPERSGDIVIFLDCFTDVARDGQGTLDRTVRAADALARAYLAQRDRVGIVSFGGTLRWLTPSMGDRQVARIVDVLLETRVVFSFARKDVAVVPPRSLPPHALVIALTPLLDDRTAEALVTLRGRGFDMVIVEISPTPFIRPAATETERQVQRLWPLWREMLRDRYEQLGVAVVEWGAENTLAELIEEARRCRRQAHRIRAGSR